MKPGTLDRRVTVLRRSLTRNEHGEQVETYSDLVTVWAQRLDTTARESFTAQTTIAEGTAKFRMRYMSDLLYTDRLSCESREYDIVQIAELGRREATEIVGIARIP